MEYDWDSAKARSNTKKHGVAFDEASTVFRDPLAYTFADPDHSAGEVRWLTFGLSGGGRILVVSHLESDHCIRIISAREATPHELKIYQEDQAR